MIPNSKTYRLNYPAGNPILMQCVTDLLSAGIAHSEVVRLAVVYYLSPTKQVGESKIMDFLEILDRHYNHEINCTLAELNYVHGGNGVSNQVYTYMRDPSYFHKTIETFVTELSQFLWLPLAERIYTANKFISVWCEGMYINITCSTMGTV